jgi:hypothetical protein
MRSAACCNSYCLRAALLLLLLRLLVYFLIATPRIHTVAFELLICTCLLLCKLAGVDTGCAVRSTTSMQQLLKWSNVIKMCKIKV